MRRSERATCARASFKQDARPPPARFGGSGFGVFAELSRELGVPLRFPGTDKAYGQLVQFTDAGLLATASVWAATAKAASDEACNVTNGDVFRWERMWEDVARLPGWKWQHQCL